MKIAVVFDCPGTLVDVKLYFLLCPLYGYLSPNGYRYSPEDVGSFPPMKMGGGKVIRYNFKSGG